MPTILASSILGSTGYDYANTIGWLVRACVWKIQRKEVNKLVQSFLKIEGRAESWWISSLFSEEEQVVLNGEIFGLENIGFPEGEFSMIRLVRANFIDGVVESESAYIKLGKSASVESMLKKMDLVTEKLRKGPISKPRK
jgi:hypothetical protein